MSRKGPETWLSRGLAKHRDQSSDTGQSDDPAIQNLHGEQTTDAVGEVEEAPSDGYFPVIADPYVQVSSHWMAPGKRFAMVRGFGKVARRAYVVRTEADGALEVNGEIEVIDAPTLDK